MENTLGGSVQGTLAATLPRLSRREILFVVALCLLPIALYLPFAAAPFERDEGVYATIAQGVLHGQVPYRDLFDNKPPLIYLWYSASFFMLGESTFAPRIVAALFLSLTTLVLFHQARMVLPKGAAYTAAALFAISTGLPWVALHANTEAYMLLPLVSSLMFFTIGMRDGRLRWFVVSGVLAGFAIMTKQVAFWNLLALALVSLIWHGRTVAAQWRAVAPTLCLFAGTLASMAVIAIPFAVSGALDDLLYANLSYNWVYVRALSYADRLANLGNIIFFLAVAAPFVAGALAGLAIVWRKRSASADYVLILWAVASAIGVASGGRFFPHYFLQLMPSLAVLTGVLIYDRMMNGGHRALSRTAWIVSAALIVISLGTTTVMYVVPKQAEQRVVERVYHQKEWEANSQLLGAYIKERTNPEDQIFNYGRESQVYFYADRQPAISLFYDWVIDYDDDALRRILEGLRETMPIYVIDSAQAPLFADWNEAHPPELLDFLDRNYEYAGRVYFADVYRLKGSPNPLAMGASSPDVTGGGSELDPLMADDYPLQ